MARFGEPSRNRRNLHSIILIIFIGLLVLSTGTIGVRAAPAESARSCSSLRSMARIYMASGGYEKARPFLERALNLAKKTNASDSEVCACMLDLAYLYKNQDKLVEAEAVCLSGLELQEKIYGQNHPYVAYTLRILSEIYQKQNRYQPAVETLEKAITLMREYNLEDDPDLAPFKVDMARLLAAQGDYVNAEAYFKKAMDTIENNYGPDHLYTTRVLCSMGALYVQQERYAEAEELISRALPVQQQIYGPGHRLLVPAWLVMSSIYEARGDMVNAKKLLEKSLAAIENPNDSGHMVECDVLSRLGQFYITSKKYSRAENVLKRALQVLENSKGADSDHEAVALNSLAKVYINQGKYSEAQSLCSRALDILENV